MMSSSFEFTADVVRAVITHMNNDHAADNLQICRHVVGSDDLRSARLIDLGPRGLIFATTGADGQEQQVIIDWGREITERGDIRRAVVALSAAASGE